LLDVAGAIGITTTSTLPVNGIYSPSANQLALVTSSSAAMTITSTGYVGIGTTSPADMLDVAGAIGITTTTARVPLNGLYSSTTNSLSLTTSGATALYVSSTGSVGIGTTTVANTLDVKGGVALDGFAGTAMRRTSPAASLVMSGALGIATTSPTTYLE